MFCFGICDAYSNERHYHHNIYVNGNKSRVFRMPCFVISSQDCELPRAHIAILSDGGFERGTFQQEHNSERRPKTTMLSRDTRLADNEPHLIALLDPSQ
jgi:hypothetical protein